MKRKLISIIIPVYKTEQYLKRCVDSVLNQTYQELECILVDDGSPDEAGKICDEYKKKDARIKVIHKENGGLSSARNAGLDIAKGDYIGFVDSDDFIHPQMYEMLVDVLEKTESGMSCCESTSCQVNESIAKTSYKIENILDDVKVYRSDEIISSYPHMYQKMFVIVMTKLYKREIFNALRFDEGKIYEDNLIYLQSVYNAGKCAVFPAKLYYYVMSDDSITRSGFSSKKLADIDVQIKFIDFFRKHQYWKQANISEKRYLDKVLFYTYFSANQEDPDSKQKMKVYRKGLLSEKKSIWKNPEIHRLLKLAFLVFCINTKISKYFYILYDRYGREEDA